MPHTATAKPDFDSTSIEPNGSWRFVADSKGAFVYICTFHRTMKGELAVR